MTITGTNFTGATAVAFGSTAATSFTVVSATQITAVAPSGSGAVSVVVTTSAGSSNSESFTYGATTTASYIYVANQNTGTIAGFSLSSGELSGLSGSPYNLGTPPSALAVTPSGSLLYVAIAAGSVFVYGANSNGALTLGNSGQPVTSTSAPLTPTYEAIDKTGNWLFLASSGSPELLEYQIDTSNGALVSPANNPIALTGGTPTQIYITPNNQFVFVGLGTGGVDVFAFNPSNGALSSSPQLLSPLQATNGDNAIGSDAASKFLFVGEAGSGVRVFTISSNGTLKEVSGSPFQTPQSDPTELGPAAFAMDPTNTYVYVANKTSSNITGYTLGSTGALTPLSTSPFTSGTGPIAMMLDASGQYLLVASYVGGPDLQVFSFDATTPGLLDAVTSTATGADPAEPISMAVAQ